MKPMKPKLSKKCIKTISFKLRNPTNLTKFNNYEKPMNLKIHRLTKSEFPVKT